MNTSPMDEGCNRSPDAFRHYRTLVEDSNREPVVVQRGFDLTDAQTTWDALTAYEAEAFGIDPRLLNALVWASVRYEDMIGTTDIEFDAWREDERRAFPEFFQGECVYSMDAAVGFMTIVCGLPFTQALLWVCRGRVQTVRSRLFAEDRPAPSWALGTVAEEHT